ncbi:MAG: hypothetical protein P4L71_15845 [Acetobacteraceae bacterium]|nr:hypothetical protein [Acetobacteraceae bacterium]
MAAKLGTGRVDPHDTGRLMQTARVQTVSVSMNNAAATRIATRPSSGNGRAFIHR